MELIVLVTVCDKTNIVEYVRALIALGCKVYSYGSTYDDLHKAGLPVEHAVELVRPLLPAGEVDPPKEMLAKWLSYILLASPDYRKARGLKYIDIVCVDLESPEVKLSSLSTASEIAEANQTGGTSLLADASKGGRIPIPTTALMGKLITWIELGRPAEAHFRGRMLKMTQQTINNYGRKLFIYYP